MNYLLSCHDPLDQSQKKSLKLEPMCPARSGSQGVGLMLALSVLEEGLRVFMCSYRLGFVFEYPGMFA